jgi:hypothetical protein
MSQLIEAPKGLLFASVIWNQDQFDFDEFKNHWQERYGVQEIFTPAYNPSFDYYEKEMGSPLARVILFSDQLSAREELVVAKKWADSFENEKSLNKARIVNVDPGLLTLENMILSTGKPYAHRIYLGEGVYADLNYIYRNGSYSGLEWTYPDYVHEEKIKLFNKIRKFLLTK